MRVIETIRFGDGRGWFAETYSRRRYAELGIDVEFCQDNHSFSEAPGVVRGLHFQRPPHAQAKLVRCIAGRIWDVAVDLRRGSPTYGKWAAAELSAGNNRQAFVPAGYAHGFVTLEPSTQVEYKVTDFYARDCEDGVLWNDPVLALPWPLPSDDPVLSAKDRGLPGFADFVTPFVYDNTPIPQALIGRTHA